MKLSGWQIVRKISDWITLQSADGQEIAFQLAPDPIPPEWPGQEHPQQVDLTIDDTEAAAERAVERLPGHEPDALVAARLRGGLPGVPLATIRP